MQDTVVACDTMTDTIKDAIKGETTVATDKDTAKDTIKDAVKGETTVAADKDAIKDTIKDAIKVNVPPMPDTVYNQWATINEGRCRSSQAWEFFDDGKTIGWQAGWLSGNSAGYTRGYDEGWAASQQGSHSAEKKPRC